MVPLIPVGGNNSLLTNNPPLLNLYGEEGHCLSCNQYMLILVYDAERLNILGWHSRRGYVQHRRTTLTINIDDMSSLIPLDLFGGEEYCSLNHLQSSILLRKDSLI